MKKSLPHIFVFLSFLVLVFLGTWQVQRLLYKNDLMQKIDSRLGLEPVEFSQFTSIENDEFRKMKLKGTFLHERELLLLNKGFNGKQGQHVITPLQLETGEILIVDRGWIPPDKDPIHYIEPVEITGIVREGQKLNTIGSLIVMENDPSKQVWFWLELPAMQKRAEADNLPFYIDLIAQEGANKDKRVTIYPIPLPAEIKLYNEHLQYAITWYSLSIALLIMYYFRFYRKK